MPDPTPDLTDAQQEPESFGHLPIQPTGSGVADLAVAYEQMRLAEDDDSADAAAIVPTEGGDDAADSAAHPS